MNNIIEIIDLLEAHQYEAEKISTEYNRKLARAGKYKQAIATLKAVESAGDVLPLEKVNTEGMAPDEERYYAGQNDLICMVKSILAKQILKNKELEAEAKLGNIPYKEAIALKAENKKLKEQQLTEPK